MPQGRRKVPFSGKAKKQQMQVKKQRQRTFGVGMFINCFYKEWRMLYLKDIYLIESNIWKNNLVWSNSTYVSAHQDDCDEGCSSETSSVEQVQKINKQPGNGKSKHNRYALQFFQEFNQELRKRKEQAFKTLEPVSLKDQEVSDNYFPPEIDMPKRPPWNFNMTKEQLDIIEHRYFTVRI